MKFLNFSFFFFFFLTIKSVNVSKSEKLLVREAMGK